MTVQISWRDREVPSDTPIAPRDLIQSEVLGRAIRHLAIEIGGRKARSEVFALVRHVRRLQRMAGRDGVDLYVYTTNQTTAPPPWSHWGLGIEIRGVRGNQIIWDIALYSSGYWAETRVPGILSRVRADAWYRRILAGAACQETERQLKRELAAQAYVASLPESVVPLQQTARATCLRVSKDGLSVTEILHDVGGSMTYTHGVNGFAIPASLAAMQRQHDAVYHK